MNRATFFMLIILSRSNQILKFGVGFAIKQNPGNWYFQVYSKFLLKTLKTQNTKVVTLEKIHNFDFWTNPKLWMDREIQERGQTGEAGTDPRSLYHMGAPSPMPYPQASNQTYLSTQALYPNHKQTSTHPMHK